MKDYHLRLPSENINNTSLFYFFLFLPEETKVQITWVIPVRLMQKSESLGLISGFTYCWKVSSCNRRINCSAAAHSAACKATSLAHLLPKGNSSYLSCCKQKGMCTSWASRSLLTGHHQIPNRTDGFLIRTWPSSQPVGTKEWEFGFKREKGLFFCKIAEDLGRVKVSKK